MTKEAPLTMASVFSGIGGELVAATMLGWDVKFFCEKNPFGNKVLSYWYPNAKNYEDITTTDFTEWRDKIDVFTGGFPCQPFSYAGQRRGATDDRYLWPYMFRCIDQVRPDWVVAENVAGILTMVEQGEVSALASQATLFDEGDDIRRYQLRETFTLQRICDDLESHGYAVQPVLIPACGVGAPHRRDRVFIIGHRINKEEDGALHQSQRVICDTTNERQGRPIDGRTISEVCCQIREEGHHAELRVSVETSSRDGLAADTDNERRGKRRGASDNGQKDRLRAPLLSDVERQGSCGATADTDRYRGSEVDEHMESELADGAKPVSNGGQRNVADTESRRAGGLRIESEEEGARMRDVVFGNGCRLYLPTDEAGLGRWQDFPSVSPVHRGNDGLPFDVDRLTISPSKWRAESLKAYGNAIVPQVMYEIFRAINLLYI